MRKAAWRATSLAESHSAALFWAMVHPFPSRMHAAPVAEATERRAYSLAESHSASAFIVTQPSKTSQHDTSPHQQAPSQRGR